MTSQALDALAVANEVRSGRRELREEIRAGRSVLTVLDEPCVRTMRVTDLLRMQPRWGLVRAERACRLVPCGPLVRVGELTARQRDALAGVLG